MKLPLSLEILDAGYGQHCDSCHKVTNTIVLTVLYQEEAIRQSHLCSTCIEVGIEIDLNLEMGSDPERKKAAQKRIKTSQHLEQVLADDMGGVTQPASGGTKLSGYKGDIRRMGEWRVEHKYTDSLKGFNLTLSDLAKIIHQALEANENPALIVEYRKARQSVAVIPLSLFLEMKDAVEKHRGPQERRGKRTEGSAQ